MICHVAFKDLQELRHDPLAPKGGEKGAILKDGGDWLLKGARKADPQICVLRLTWPIHYAPHHRHLKVLNSWVQWAPLW
jgi:hypothetical protein